ncbi:MAG TPA: chloride channel protein [Gemmatimonadales bacterium]|nr:chloride channel protein [Gemmatimonadales bacterium]
MTETTEPRTAPDYTLDRRVVLLTLVAVAIGALGALVADALLHLIDIFTNFFYYQRLSAAHVVPGGNRLGVVAVLVPVLGGLIVGLMARYGSEKIRGHGIPEAIEAILTGSRIEARVALLKPLSAAVALGTGGPFGAEGPIIVTGGAVGSLVAQGFRLSAAERKTLLAAGAAAGMAGIFATPLAAVVLAIEVLLFEWKPRSFIPVAAAAATAWAVRIPLLGAGPLFPLGEHGAVTARVLLACVGLGAAAALAATCASALVYRAEDAFARLPLHWMWWPALGGIVVGVGGLISPRALGVGYETIHDLVAGNLGLGLVTTLLVTKAIIWSVALGSGTSGGVFAPLLIMGGALGALCAELLGAHDPGLWAALGMGAMLGGTMHAPFTAIVFLVEATGDVRLLPPLLVSCVTAAAVAVLGMRHSILTERLARRGRPVTREYIVNPMRLLRVEDVMQRDVPTIPATLAVDQLFHRVLHEDPLYGRRNGWPLVDDAGRLVGMLTRSDLVRALETTDDDRQQTAADLGSRTLVVAHPDELLATAADRMLRADVGRLPVVRRDDSQALVGNLGRAEILGAWLQAARDERDRDPGWIARGAARVRRALATRQG